MTLKFCLDARGIRMNLLCIVQSLPFFPSLLLFLFAVTPGIEGHGHVAWRSPRSVLLAV